MDISLPSSHNKTHKDFKNPSLVVQKEASKKSDWLELGLGFYNNQEMSQHPLSVSASKPPPCSSFLSSTPTTQLKTQNNEQQEKIELGLGLELELGLGFKNETCMTALEHEGNDDGSDRWNPWKSDYSSEDETNQNDNYIFNYDYSTITTTRPNSVPWFWFTLQASTGRNGEALLQIPKAYIRVKDENVTVSTVKKYLVTKLGFSNQIEVDVSCMGHKLLETNTLKQIRDVIWLPGMMDSTSYHQTSLDYILPLEYSMMQ